MTKKIIIASVVILVIAITSVLWWRNSHQKYAGPVEIIRLATSKAGGELSSLIWIADDQGYFKDQRLDVQITPENTGVVAQQKVASGNADMANTSEFAFVSDSFTTNNLRILATIAHSKVVDIVVRKDVISKPADLKGKKIGVNFKTAPEYYLGQFLLLNNISVNEVNIVNMQFTEMQEAIKSGRVDAIVANDPFVYPIKTALGENGLDWPAQGNQDNSWLVVSNEQFVKDHPETIKRFLAAVLQAEQFVKDNPEKSKQIIKDKLKLEQNYFEQNWPKHTFELSLTQSLLVYMENEARWRIANKLTDKTLVPNYADFIYPDALRTVNPDAVTLY